jgi:hypothetical protein
MNLDFLAGLISVVVVVIIFFLVSFLLFIKYTNKYKIFFGLILNLFICLVIYYFGTAMLLGPLANLYPNQLGVSCFLLNGQNCNSRSDCVIVIDPCGTDHCSKSCITRPPRTMDTNGLHQIYR